MNEVELYHIHRYNENNRLWVPEKLFMSLQIG